MNLQIPDKTIIEKAIYIQRLSSDLFFFIQEAWATVEVEPYSNNWHIELCCRHLEAVERGDTLELAMMLPPGHMKSLLTAVFFPAWVWLSRPYTRWIFATYSGDFSMRDAGKRLRLIRSDWYKNICDITITRDAIGRIENSQGGFWLATSTGGVGTGERAHYCINDDLLRMNDADSAAYRREAITHMEAMGNRGVSQDGYRQIVAAQRLHPDDPIGWALLQGWPYLILPVDEPGKSTLFLNWTDSRKSGDILFPERFGREYLEKQKKSLGSRKYEGQYRQNAVIAEGGIIKREWLYNKMYKVKPAHFDEINQSWDCKLGGKSKDSDYVVGQVWGRVGPDKYLLDQVSGQWQFTETRQAMRQMFHKWPGGAKWIEAKAEGSAAASDLSREFPGIILVNPDKWGGKPLRISAISVEFEAGNIHLPDPSIAPWVGDLVEQICGFTEEGPSTAHDDMADACSMAILKFAEKKGHSLAAGGVRFVV